MSAELDRRTTVDRAIGVIMQQQVTDYWAALRSLVVTSIRDDVTVHESAVRVLRDVR